ncbi:MAG: Trk family potassium uptake protein [Theionarchaea archaeon]|nr:Trk family potassium uptake protein [Theionarchaea archaeon]MBU7000125.1 Trk family potassium uptake protein [Theionarchaea archaeon]MBU7020842.1 Trk family potassium uptake protein [Theionarchaea archaeon]MBU7033922.1 Trk family potassium uptake protein [Theionarchaea archaeon]MBU7039218.1 Trk family potassium uptake protein [Theionarchaea archaeon]
MNRLIGKVKPIQFLVIGYIAIICIGSLFLYLPAASSAGTSQDYVDALFTATSAVSTTGLVVVDTGTFYSGFGQFIILLLFQIGGLGYMVFVVFMVYALGRKPSLTSAVTLQQSLSGVTLGNMKQYLKAVLVFTLLFEGLGALVLSIYWMDRFTPSEAVFLGVFHSVSAFCTSGFSIFSDSFNSYQTSVFMNVVLGILCIGGGIGFIVLSDLQNLVRKRISGVRPCRLSLHSNMSLLISALLMMTGAFVLMSQESSIPLSDRMLPSLFQSVSASSTTGFNTVDIGALTTSSLFMLAILMAIGASPGGSGGGIKVTAVGSMMLSVWALLRGRKEVKAFGWQIPEETVRRSFAVATLVAIWVILVTMVLSATEDGTFMQVLFEVISAVGTVGLTTGLTPMLTSLGKVLIITTMLIGRVGPLAIAFTVLGEEKASFEHAEGEIYIG